MATPDADVQKQINHMIAFIEQEAKEKAEEITAKGEEEFNIEKGKLVQQERVRIMDVYTRKEKQVELQKTIQHSQMHNQSRLSLLKRREEIIYDILAEAEQRLGEVTKDSGKYSQLMSGLILQGLLQLMETNVSLCIKEKDKGIVQNIVPTCRNKYKDMTKKDVTVKIETDRYLPPATKGGVELIARKGRIRIMNTLEARLKHIAEQLLPDIRNAVFGKNPSRKFMD